MKMDLALRDLVKVQDMFTIRTIYYSSLFFSGFEIAILLSWIV